jgi:hypothetical protein
LQSVAAQNCVATQVQPALMQQSSFQWRLEGTVMPVSASLPDPLLSQDIGLAFLAIGSMTCSIAFCR